MTAQRGQRVFGAGRFYGILTTPDISTPNPFLVTQNVSLEFKRDIKRLHGYDQLPVDVASGMMTISGKAEHSAIAARAFNDMMIGGTLSTGQIPYTAAESLAMTTGSTATVAAANGAAFIQDLGVYGGTDGVPLVKVATASAVLADQYSVSTLGVYQFSSLAARTSVKASYLYSTVSGQTITMTNQPMGKTGGFEAVIGWLYGTEKGTVDLVNCIGANYNFATKLDDFMRPTFDFEAAVGDDGTLGTFSFAELS